MSYGDGRGLDSVCRSDTGCPACCVRERECLCVCVGVELGGAEKEEYFFPSLCYFGPKGFIW